MRRKREQEDLKREREEAAREAELRRERQRLEEQRQDDDRAEREHLAREQRLLARKQVLGLKLGGWIVVSPSIPEEEPIRLKLAVRINASRELVFVDRLGLNRREFLEDNLVEGIVVGRIRVLGSSAEFDDTLSRVVGRIRVDRN
ncbi:DUF1631 family protein [Marinobacter sp. M216]|uniref:DUF1631 family protein n=1 Tax=Marinobacter albus TaxID=3030833 RepID=A0ABT7HBN6_9GAMM|nr:DUF1631 family protein [Marinobacter sp. M216]MDK9557773.1 DUF1631 family protein [Marinobacter sp. M216]